MATRKRVSRTANARRQRARSRANAKATPTPKAAKAKTKAGAKAKAAATAKPKAKVTRPTKPKAKVTRPTKPKAKVTRPTKPSATTKAKATAKATAKARVPKPHATAKPARPDRTTSAVTPATPAVRAPDWRPALRAAVEAAGPDFGAYLAGLGAAGWEHADAPELAGLEQWGTELAKQDRRAGIGALVRTAQYGLPIILERGGIGIENCGFHASEPSHDGAPVERQVQLAAAWLESPDQAHQDAVRAGNDPSRQLFIWDDDLRPNDDRAHWWYQDVGQCCGHAITRTSGTSGGNGYYEWPPETCVGRGLVLAVRGLRERGAKLRDILASVREALVA